MGKSSIFSQLTGVNVVTSNYPGTTVDINVGLMEHEGVKIGIVDLPGIYSIGAIYEDQWVARRGILEAKPDVVIVVVDASNLQRNLYLVLQLLEMGLRVVVDLNMVDHAEKLGLKINPTLLSKKLGAPVVPTVAVRGEGIGNLIQTAINCARKTRFKPTRFTYSRDVEAAIAKIEAIVKERFGSLPFGIHSRSLAILLLEGDPEFTGTLKEHGADEALQLATHLSNRLTASGGEPMNVRMARERYGMTGLIALEATKYTKVKPLLSQKIGEITIRPLTGFPIMVMVMASLFALLLYGGGSLESLLVEGYSKYVAPTLSALFRLVSPNDTVANILNLGINLGVEGILAIMIPYILVFFLALALLEDSGYLPRVAFIMDSAMHKMGLHGRAIIPMLGGFGCNVPAVMATRVLSKRERHILALLITLIPCSARTAIILGMVSLFLGASYAVVLYAIILLLIGIIGRLLHLALPGQTPGLILEVPPLRSPMLKGVLLKTWIRMKYFLLMAVPLLLIGSLLIATLEVSGLMSFIVDPLSPVTVGWLGLPAMTMVPLLYGFIRKEGALVLLTVVAGTSNLRDFMSPIQIFVYALVVSLYVPCIATVAVLAKEFGRKNALFISLGTFLIALAVGGLFYHLNPLGLGR